MWQMCVCVYTCELLPQHLRLGKGSVAFMCIYACMHACVHIYIYIYTHTHIHIYIHLRLGKGSVAFKERLALLRRRGLTLLPQRLGLLARPRRPRAARGLELGHAHLQYIYVHIYIIYTYRSQHCTMY